MGASRRRVEDNRFIAAGAIGIDDVVLPECCTWKFSAAVAHARIRSIVSVRRGKFRVCACVDRRHDKPATRDADLSYDTQAARDRQSPIPRARGGSGHCRWFIHRKRCLRGDRR